MALVVRNAVLWRPQERFLVALVARHRILLPQGSSVKTCRVLSSSSSQSADPSQPGSGRSQFKENPVNPSILKYIENIGVGKPKRQTKRRRRPQKSLVLSHQEEQEQFQRIRRLPSTSPPPPFAPHKNSKDDKTESGKIIKRYPVKLIGSVGSSDEEFPRATPGLPEVAIAGRSNVGKSTLLNALLYGIQPNRDEEEEPYVPFRKQGRPTRRTAKLPRGLKAATSSKPGETRRLSFYQLSARVDSAKLSLMMVDLPGYGFAFASEEKAGQWQSLMASYIVDRGKSLKRILLLVDSRHGMKKADVEFMESLQKALYEKKDGTSPMKRELPPIQLVLTKCDLVSQADLARRVEMTRQQLSDCLRRQPSALPIMLVSAQMEGQSGVLEVQKELASLVPVHK